MSRTKFIAILIINVSFFASSILFSANRTQNASSRIKIIKNHPDKGKPSKLIRRLFNDYRRLKFGNTDSYVIGAMAKIVNGIKRFMLECSPSQLDKMRSKFTRLYENRIYNEVFLKKYPKKILYAKVDTLWIYKAPANSNYFYKVRDMSFLLTKKSGKWFIKNIRFQGEHVLYDIKKVRRIQRMAERADRSRGSYRRRGRRRFRYYRRRR